MLEPIFNDLSAEPIADDIATAFRRMSQLIELLRIAPDYGLSPGLRILTTFHNLPLGPEYHVFNWFNDSRVPREQTLFMLTQTTRYPFLDEASGAIRNQAALVDVRFNGKMSAALCSAYLLETPLFSMFHEPWGVAFINCDCEELINDTLVPPHAVSLQNLAEASHFQVHTDWIQGRKQRSIGSSRDLWERRDVLFPHLKFCPTVEDQLTRFQPHEPRFRQVINKLFDMEVYFANWIAGGFAPDAFPKCNPVSPETLRRYRENYLYQTENGQDVLASWHLYLTPGKGRLYFDPDSSSRLGIVCYVGDKLPDVTYGSH